ncbi:MAG TPA: hypothetical protein VN962_13725 [Polyangia bacterium]|nr:hypothetical protein [Polyangia bacterium]
MRRATCIGLLLVGVGCGSGRLTGPSDAATPDAPSSADGPPAAADAGRPRRVDILFMIDNSSEMSSMQQKLVAQLPVFVSTLENLPGGFPDLHLAVVSSDMGAPGDQSASIGCTTAGDQGVFQADPRGTCTSSGLQAGATFISNVGGVANYTGSLTDVLSCIVPLGNSGCGFEHQLASVARALGADGAPPPPQNAGFLRPDAELAIFLLTNEDDCSAPATTTLYSLNGGPQSLKNPLGPITNYRCNQFGHLCQDPTGPAPAEWLSPPLAVPSDAAGNPPTVTYAACMSNEGRNTMLTPLARFIDGIKALKADPSRVVVGGIIGPTSPYAVTWVPPASPPPGTSGELWPFTMHSCGAAGGYLGPGAQLTADGSFGDPSVRVGQWIQALGGTIGSVCDASYAAPLGQFASAIAAGL